jgi:hypothetical protein
LRPTPAGMIYCLRCREPRPPDGGFVDYQPRSAGAGDLVGICPVCEAMLYRRVNRAHLDSVSGGLEVRITQADSRIAVIESQSLPIGQNAPVSQILTLAHRLRSLSGRCFLNN